MVSPENSEDGQMPHVADRSGILGQQGYFQPTPIMQQQPVMNRVMPMPQQALGMPQISQPGAMLVQSQGMVHVQHDDPVAKRRRMEVAQMVSVASSPAVMLNGQQLAAAAAQAMTQGRSRKKSQAQIDRRRERNRILARRTRLRKKFFFESLQKEVMDLQKENEHLKSVVKSELEEADSKQILDECDAMEKLPPAVLEACGEGGILDAQDFNLVQAIQNAQHSFVITDPSLNDNPIVFASDDFLKLTGYSREQVLGRNCRFLQGTDTDPEKVNQIRQDLAVGDDVSITLLNYTADGKPFWNKLFIAALRDAQNNIVNYIGVIVKVAAPQPGDPEHAKAVAMIKRTSKDDDYDDEDEDDDEADDAVRAIEGGLSAAVAAANY